MAETKLIPFDLKALIVSHLFGPFNYRPEAFGMTGSGVVPLELAEVRKTQRRVAALLNLPFTGTCLCVKRGHLFSSGVCYFCSQLNSYRRVGGDRGRNRKCPHAPPVPQNSFLGYEGGIKDDLGLKANLFDTTIFKEGTDPLGFKLPPVFSKTPDSPGKRQNGDTLQEGRRSNGKKKKTPRSRIIPTVSENTFVNSNLRDSDMEVDAGFYDHDSSYEEDFVYEEEADDTTKSQVHLPQIRSGQPNLVSSWNGEEYDRKTGSSDGVSTTSWSEPVMERTMTLDRDKTGASLRIDEDYVPMSVFIKQVADSQRSDLGESPYQYEDDLSSSISGSLGVSRETSLGESDRSQGSLSNYCMCLEPMTDELPCTECLHPHAHERWCTRRHEANECRRLCLVCGKLIRPLKSKKRGRPEHRKHARSIDRRDSRFRQTPDTSATNSSEQMHDRASCSGKKKHGGQKKTSKSSFERLNPDLHVRFDDQVQAVSPDNGKILPNTALDYGKVLNYDHAPHSKVEERQSPVFKVRHPKPDIKIPNLGVNVHKLAYDMALSDARATGAYKKKGRKKKDRIGSEKLTGTVFSYFPLLKVKRPLSEGEAATEEIGVRQDHGQKVAPKNGMKHIFGNIKLADYYPGGKKWRAVD